MKSFKYSCIGEELHPTLNSVYFRNAQSAESRLFQEKKSKFAFIKFFFFIFLSILGRKHYDIMGMMGYETFLLDRDFVWKNILKLKKRKTLLDIGAGDGSITQVFEDYVESISCLEPSPSFQKTLKKRGYSLHEKTADKKYDIVTIFNVFDICNDPEAIITDAKEALNPSGLMIISLPFPICTRSWDNRKIRKTNHLCQTRETSFEGGVSNFYINFLRKHGLRAVAFTRLPYIVSLPETYKTTVYDNGLFICQRDSDN